MEEDQPQGSLLKSAKQFRQQLAELQICKVSEGQILGEEILFNESGINEYSAKVFSLQCSVLAVEKQKFYNKFPPECRVIMKGINYNYKEQFLMKQKQRQIALDQQKTLFKSIQNNQESPEFSSKPVSNNHNIEGDASIIKLLRDYTHSQSTK